MPYKLAAKAGKGDVKNNQLILPKHIFNEGSVVFNNVLMRIGMCFYLQEKRYWMKGNQGEEQKGAYNAR
jgi:hypothetical protein